jgi:lysophospholipase L1-like esterase
MRSWFLPLAALLAFAANLSGADPRPIILGLAGDSTMCNYPAGSPQRGWGEFIQPYFDDGVVVENLAKSGRSTKTFLSEGWWGKLMQKKPDIVLIQFGHNDSHAPDHPEHTVAEGDYKTYLDQFVREARAIGADPVLITPVQRRTPTDGLIPYANAMTEVAVADQVKVIDLHALSGEFYARLSEAEMVALEKPGDRTHFSAQGARRIAALVMPALLAAEPELRSHLRTPVLPP